ncbi:transposon Ty3-G Gag-Pol polyprotein [Trichonephila inaurata madagascariensis]|uniref:Transposon Ty3-G Gag-Pol polyprotein n=1 Tax=Trichonephila inaurata madagascariensis TaxID=2747483 RepID=A0A8X6XQ59_9ARAC|nr:transposon Ty3-G Gag-Pol polyprotein [Trichonephila inaurata madagascariensis]
MCAYTRITIDALASEIGISYGTVHGILQDYLNVHPSRNLDEHISHFKDTFRCLEENGLVLKISKSIFAKPEVEFLGHHISVNGIRPTTEQIQAILDFNRPSTIKQPRTFFGRLNFYRRFLPSAAKHQKN